MTMKGRVFTSVSVGKPVKGNLNGSVVSTAVDAGLAVGETAADGVPTASGLFVGTEAGVLPQPARAMTEHPRTTRC
ncbi:hypothetical protein BC351_29965 [Paenibacillus ferrarius]|uniref:Uncharacterized protein n=1 Tax=Paenibacillus ferrarius TaxID=1469647 RepID=A0A1V4HHM1_9BACL|nr:hypothetical protein [Paenibacillus ferrarius]OPH54953.1 hypothetical protein BC351_29965 [Paenibacillus ferrarius]